MLGKVKPCKYCGQDTHFAFACFNRPHNQRAVKRKEIVRKAKLQRKGAHAKKWQETRAEWFRQNPADTYDCYICHKAMTREETTLDHIRSRGRYPHLRYVLSNLAPCCWPCNTAKGSLDLQQYLNKLAASKGQVRSM